MASEQLLKVSDRTWISPNYPIATHRKVELASYNPIKRRDGEPVKAVKLATDVSERKMLDDDGQEQIRAIGKSQGVAAALRHCGKYAFVKTSCCVTAPRG
jgi:hypothetical protein